VFDFLNVTETYFSSHDNGAGIATALAVEYPSLIKLLGVSESAVPGFENQRTDAPAAY
jgi:hypothetical protein